MKTYIGRTDGNGWWSVFVQKEDALGYEETALPLRLDLANHSPDGFAWGYGGSGPAQLALALLADLVGDAEALIYYQDFKKYFAQIPSNESWMMSENLARLMLRECKL